MAKDGGLAKSRKSAIDCRASIYTYDLSWQDSEHHKISLNGENIKYNLLSDPLYLDMKIDEIMGTLLHEGLRENLVYDDLSTSVTVTIGHGGEAQGLLIFNCLFIYFLLYVFVPFWLVCIHVWNIDFVITFFVIY
jgi:hypothetical protein